MFLDNPIIAKYSHCPKEQISKVQVKVVGGELARHRFRKFLP